MISQEYSKHKISRATFLATLTATLLLSASPSFGQSTATQEIETVVVTGSKMPDIQGLFTQQDIAKTRSVITQDFISSQIDGQAIVTETNLLPGVSVTNNDSYGASGADLRMRGFANNRISVQLDGIPLNDTGNYAIYVGEYIDSEVVDRVTVNTGATDVDSPTASATGGTINITTLVPSDQASLRATASEGSFNYTNMTVMAQSGSFGPWDTKGYIEASYIDYDKFKGPGTLIRRQANARLYQDLGGGDFMSIAANWDPNLVDFYQSNSKATFAANWKADYAPTCVRLAVPASNGVANVEASCNSYFGVKINPSLSGNIRGQSLFTITDDLKLTFDPYLQFVLANGGGTQVISERDPRLIGGTLGTGVDLNGDGDTLDKINLYTPSNTNTRRWGLTTSLLWTPLENSIVQFSYTLDYGLHRQTGQMGFLTQGTNLPVPVNHYGGLSGTPVVGDDGLDLRLRDRKSKAILNQVSLDYEGDFLDNTVHVSVGVRAPFFERDLNQYCYTVEKSGTGGPGGSNLSPNSSSGQYCTSQAPITVVNPAGVQAGTYVEFAGGTAIFDAPYHATKDFNRVLPNVGLSYKPWGSEHQFYAAYAQTLSSPITDDLYATPRIRVSPETSTMYDLGYRYTGPDGLLAEVDVWHGIWQNHIVSSYNAADNYTLDTNVGPVLLTGFDASIGAEPIDNLSVYGTVSWETTKLKDNIVTSSGVLATAGKQVVETPDWMFSGRIQYKIAGFKIGLQGKYTGRRFSTDLNDEQTSPYTVVDADLSYDLGTLGWDNAELRLNITNLFGEKYLGSISPTNTASGVPFYYEGAPRTVVGTFRLAL